MVDFVREWAGKERHFRLDLGGVLDLEEAVDEGIGTIFIAVAGGNFKAGYLYHTIRLALIGGGERVVDAERLVKDRLALTPWMEVAALAGEILTALMGGVEPTDDDETSESGGKLIFSEISQICRVFHMSPVDLRAMSYADFVNMVRGFNAAQSEEIPHITEEEFEDILNRYEPEV